MLLKCNTSVLQEESKWPVLNKANVRVGSHLGLAMSTERSLHLYADNKDQGVVAARMPDPCYFMFDLMDYCTKVAYGIVCC